MGFVLHVTDRRVGNVLGAMDGAGRTHQKRTLNLAIHLNENVYEDVPHRQFVFTIPKRFRLYFRYTRDLLSDLARCALSDSEEVLLGRAWQTIRDVYGFALGEEYKPGMVGTIQTFGSEGLWPNTP